MAPTIESDENDLILKVITDAEQNLNCDFSLKTEQKSAFHAIYAVSKVLVKNVQFATVFRKERKKDDFSLKILAITDFRFYILSQTLMKVEYNFHLGDIISVESKNTKKAVITTRSKTLTLVNQDEDPRYNLDVVIGSVLLALKFIYPDLPFQKLLKRIVMQPEGRLESLVRQLTEKMTNKHVGPCGNYSIMYHSLCDQNSLDFMADVAWDVDTIYLSQDSKEFNFRDFDHLDSRHFVPMISALEQNSWFTRLNFSTIRLTPQIINEILKVVKSNQVVKELVLSSTGIRSDFIQKLCIAVQTNKSNSLTVIELSENSIEDKGLQYLSVLPFGWVTLNLSRTSISASGLAQLSDTFVKKNVAIASTLSSLDLSGNIFRGDGIMSFFNFLSKPNVLKSLRLASTEMPLDNLFSSLLQGCIKCLEFLDVSGNQYNSKKSSKENVFLTSWKEFFCAANSLKSVNFSSNRLSSEAVKFILLGRASNPSKSSFELNLSSNFLGNGGCEVLEVCLPIVDNVTSLDISDNGFDSDLVIILNKMRLNKSIRKLLIGRNFPNIKPKSISSVMESLVQLFQEENSPIECLHIDNLALKTDGTLFINSLGGNNSLTEINISGNQLGDSSIRMLSKALQINKKLSIIHWDRNNTSPSGFQDIAHALSKNYTLLQMPSPLNDIVNALRINSEKTEQAIQEIESCLLRNRTPRKLSTEQGFQLQQDLLFSSTRKQMDKLTNQLQIVIVETEQSKSLNEATISEIMRAKALLTEADTSRQLLMDLQKVALKSEESEGVVQVQMKSFAEQLHAEFMDQIKTNIVNMMKCARTKCPVLLSNQKLSDDILSSSASVGSVSSEFISDIIGQRMSTSVMNKMSEINLAIATHISEQVVEEIMTALTECISNLKSGVTKTQAVEVKTQTKISLPAVALRKPASDTSNGSSDELRTARVEKPEIVEKRKTVFQRRQRPDSMLAKIKYNSMPEPSLFSSFHIMFTIGGRAGHRGKNRLKSHDVAGSLKQQSELSTSCPDLLKSDDSFPSAIKIPSNCENLVRAPVSSNLALSASGAEPSSEFHPSDLALEPIPVKPTRKRYSRTSKMLEPPPTPPAATVPIRRDLTPTDFKSTKPLICPQTAPAGKLMDGSTDFKSTKPIICPQTAPAGNLMDGSTDFKSTKPIIYPLTAPAGKLMDDSKRFHEGIAEEGKPSPAPMTKEIKKKLSKSNSMNGLKKKKNKEASFKEKVELPKLNSDAPKLDHIGKDRPRPMKKYKATARPTVASPKDGNGEETNMEEGLNQFFGKKSPSDNKNSDVKVNGSNVEASKVKVLPPTPPAKPSKTLLSLSSDNEVDERKRSVDSDESNI